MEYNRYRHNGLICYQCKDRFAEIGSIACSHCNNEGIKKAKERLDIEFFAKVIFPELPEPLRKKLSYDNMNDICNVVSRHGKFIKEQQTKQEK